MNTIIHIKQRNKTNKLKKKFFLIKKMKNVDSVKEHVFQLKRVLINVSLHDRTI